MELQSIMQHLDETRDELVEMLSGLNEEQLHKRKNLNSWSISQIGQHLYTVEELYVVAIRKGLKSNEDSFIESKPIEVMLDRSKKFEAPDMVKPTEEYLGYHEILERLTNSRHKLYELLQSLEDPSVLSRRYFIHPAFQELSLLEWVKSLYIHEQRHMKQIREIIDAGYPFDA
ncbi:DinB family protein [Paenibacillus arenosi]|uniref:DinB family protein n=1 Tax=Paenibacillus arenosi TaxID=2774142 RepID=A0ABR9B719_9BACL|nr:DinB family protein [Paenibacillus arenosi]MBD8501202.1 DinB family protein [Paenibacillus arenosi]